ncbi:MULTISPECIES: diguanylate cyclase domain-containing protein [Methylomonas]|uniref:Diguanylate cyclase n=1 Tax=Methylomonas koyamae TaxID=702114 RepID=A0A177NZU9_9GAMM|nr:diguanylate cyclase [Methylomonas koyamae]OAI23174.1 diguanylate cyclase [Methylomonas koyamae]
MTAVKKRYLYHKLAKSVFWAALLLTVFTSVLYFYAEFRRSKEKTVIMINQLLDTVESTSAIAAYSNNSSIGEDVLKGLLRNDIVHEAQLSNNQGLQLTKARNTEVPKQDQIIRILRSPFGEAEVIGRLTVTPEAQYNLLEARHSALFSALNSSALIGLTALIVLLMVRSSLSRPLMKVSDTLHAIMAGEQERLEPLPHNQDELGQLVEDINGLLETLQEKFKTEHTLREEIEIIEKQLRDIFETTSAGIFLLDEAGRLKTVNPILSKVIGLRHLSTIELLGQDFAELAFAEPAIVRELMYRAVERRQTVSQDLCLKNLTSWVHCMLSLQISNRFSPCFEGVVYDITDRVAAETRIRHEADHDSLTGLLRRQAAERQLTSLIHARRDQDNAPVILLLDLDRFKEINDTYGHDAGDRVLVETAARLENCVRTSDIVARLGGDEFLIVLVNCASVEHVRQIAGDIVLAIGKPIQLNSTQNVTMGVSIGICIEEGSSQTLEELYKQADQAMYEVKRQGRNGFAMTLADGTIVVEKVAIDG